MFQVRQLTDAELRLFQEGDIKSINKVSWTSKHDEC